MKKTCLQKKLYESEPGELSLKLKPGLKRPAAEETEADRMSLKKSGKDLERGS